MPRLRVRMSLTDPRPEARPVDWRRRATTWGVSLAMHLLMLIPLGFIAFVDLGGHGSGGFGSGIWGSPEGDASGDLDSLLDVPGLGDPLTALDDGEDALLTAMAEPSDRPVLDLESVVPRPLSLDNNARGGAAPLFGDGGDGNDKARGPVGEGQRLGDGKPSNVPITGRKGPLKLELLRTEGGTPASEAAVDLGLDWLARHQRSDGSWSLDTQGLCKGFNEPCPHQAVTTSDTGATGLALLAFLGAGHNHKDEGRYQQTVFRGLRWLIAHQSGDGNFYTGGEYRAPLYSQAIACMAICESLALTRDDDLKKPAVNGLKFILRAQNKMGGGWRYVPTIDGDTSVFGWQMFALRSGQFAGYASPKKAVQLSRAYLDTAASDRRGVTYGYLPGRDATPSMTAEGLLCRQYLGWPKDHPSLVAGADLVTKELLSGEQGRNIYYWYYATQLLHNMGGPAWTAWNVKMRETLIADQVTQAGCVRGSWDPIAPEEDRWGAVAGRVYQTSLSLLSLEVYYRFLPLYRTENLELAVEGEGDKAKDKAKEKDADRAGETPADRTP